MATSVKGEPARPEPVAEEPGDTAGWWRRRPERTGTAARVLGWLLPALLTLALGTHDGGRPQLWRDELATWSAATRSTGDLFRLLHHVDAVSGTYYLFMHGWIGLFGDSPAVLRLPSALAMAGAAAFVALAGRTQFDARTGLVAGLLFAVLPSVSRYSQEARAYAFAVLAMAAATWLLLRALERPGVLRWLLYALCLSAGGLMHMVCLLTVAGHLALVLLRWWHVRDRRMLLGFPLAVLVGLLPVLPVALLGRHQSGRQISWLDRPDLQSFVDTWHGLFGSAWVSGCVIGLAALPAAWPRGRRPALEIGLVAGLPVVLNWYASQGQTAYFLDRYLLFTTPAWAVVAGAGLAALRPRALAALGLAGVTLLGVQDQQRLRNPDAHEWSDERGAAAVVARSYRPGDGFVPVRGEGAFMMLDFALDYYLPPAARPVDVFAGRTAVQRGDFFTSPCTPAAVCLGSTPRVWVVVYGNAQNPYQGLRADEVAALTAGYVPEKVTVVRGIAVTLLERRTPAP
ncbi:glycosyltransferase family 39 protein [Kitasatospora sp. NPDC058965]|uniref:glycosyltransferase family 39 protein n=1 Tax=Kitasatospora sp. NPDC058965 TaxID=3346682 RepID=UPI0036A17A92